MSFQHKMVLIKIPRIIEKLEQNELGENFTTDELLTMTCCCWKVKLERVNQYPYAATVIDNKIVAVFKVRKWLLIKEIERCHFIGHFDPVITSQYKEQDVSDLYNSSQNPIHYVDI